MESDEVYLRYQELQRYVGWSDADSGRIQSVAKLLEPQLALLVDDFYAEIDRHPNARRVITGGVEQIARLKGTLVAWLRELLAGPYDQGYVDRRWRVGWRHVEIGLNQVYTNVALSRLRRGLIESLESRWNGERAALTAVIRSLNMLLDLDLAIIEDAYQTEYLLRQQRTERLATIGQIAGGVAHELRNPLNVVRTSVYYLRNSKNPRPEKVAEHLERIDRHVGVADSVITALSNFAKMPIPNLKEITLAPFLQESLELNPIPGTMTVTIDCPAETPQVLADPDQLRIVIGNLIRNAREAMSDGGQLTIQCRADVAGVEIAVTDTGKGIAAEHLKRIAEPLFSTKARGLGLGLAITKAILDKNNGSLSVVSEVGKGSTFTVRLAAAAGKDGELKR